MGRFENAILFGLVMKKKEEEKVVFFIKPKKKVAMGLIL